jgi:hypothetical protein
MATPPAPPPPAAAGLVPHRLTVGASSRMREAGSLTLTADDRAELLGGRMADAPPLAPFPASAVDTCEAACAPRMVARRGRPRAARARAGQEA